MAQENRKEDLVPSETSLSRNWRPVMGWTYAIICFFDFVIIPLLLAVTNPYLASAWIPMTLKGGALFHIAMAPIMGLNVWSRGQEKMKYMDTVSNISEERIPNARKLRKIDKTFEG